MPIERFRGRRGAQDEGLDRAAVTELEAGGRGVEARPLPRQPLSPKEIISSERSTRPIRQLEIYELPARFGLRASRCEATIVSPMSCATLFESQRRRLWPISTSWRDCEEGTVAVM